MLQLFKKYKSVIRFILIFLGSYFIMSLFYNIYLELSNSSKYFPDFFTFLVSVQTEAVIEFLGYASKIIPHESEDSMKLFINDHFLVRIVEGCNSISIIILFTSFILAFFAEAKKSILFILAGSVIIYVMNIIRIAILTVGIYEYPHRGEFLHSIFFPLIIYGTVFLLWIIWVRIYSKTTAYEEEL